MVCTLFFRNEIDFGIQPGIGNVKLSKENKGSAEKSGLQLTNFESTCLLNGSVMAEWKTHPLIQEL